MIWSHKQRNLLSYTSNEVKTCCGYETFDRLMKLAWDNDNEMDAFDVSLICSLLFDLQKDEREGVTTAMREASAKKITEIVNRSKQWT